MKPQENPFADVEAVPGNPFTPLAYRAYGEAAKQAALYELKCRLLANRENIHEKTAFEKFEKVEQLILKAYADFLKEDDLAILGKARKIRNKLLHSDFPALFKHIKALGESVVSDPQAWLVKLDTGETKTVRDTSKREGGIFGWLLEAQAAGALEAAWRILRHSREIIDRISYDSAWKGISKVTAQSKSTADPQ